MIVNYLGELKIYKKILNTPNIMRVLQKLVYVLSRNKTKNIRQYGFLQDKSGRLMEFYNAMLDEKFNTDEEAAKTLLGTTPKDKTYRRLKNKLKKELLNALFFVDTSKGNYTDLQKAHLECYKNWANLKILYAHTANSSVSLEFFEKILTKAIKFGFTDIVFDVSRILSTQYSYHFGDRKRFIKYEKLMNHYLFILQLEVKAEALYNKITLEYVRSKSAKPELFLFIQEHFAEFKDYLGKINSHRFNSKGYLIGVYMYMSKNDYKNTIKICEEALHYFDNRPYEHKMTQLAFLNQLTGCCTQLKLFKKGEASALRSIELAQEGISNWHRSRETYLTLLLHQGKYKQAYQVFQTARKHKSYKFLNDHTKERWQIYEAYIELLYEMNQVEEEVTPKKKFKVSKFLNEVPTYAKDKRGYNIPIIIVQFLFLVKRKKYDAARQRIEALEKYGGRYLKKNDTFRTSCFIKMLSQFSKYGYQKKAIHRNTSKLLEKLNEVPLEIADQANEIEVIPYEMLWELALEVL